MHKEILLLFLSLVLYFFATAQAEKWTTLFDGKTLHGWTQKAVRLRINVRALPVYFLLFFTVFILSCHSNSIGPVDYLNWITAHRTVLTASQRQGDVTTTLTYLPIDWLAIKEAGEHPEQMAVVRKEYEGLEYYRLRIAIENGDVLQFQAASTDEYYQRVEYFSFGLQHDLHLLAGNDTLACQLFHFERNYGAAPYLDFMLGFAQKEGNNADRTLIYTDRVFSGASIPLTIPLENIKSIPNLKL